MKSIISLFLMFPIFVFSNNIQIENVSLTNQNTSQDYYMIEFDISWENSWRTSTFESNWDAAWVFVKFSPKNHRDWHHAALHYVDGFNDGHTTPPGASIQTMVNGYGSSTEGVGVMIYRSNDGIGNIGWKNVQLRWDYGLDGISDDQLVEISAFAIEMVYVPQGAFYVGDGGNNGLEAGNTGQPFLISSEAAIPLGGTDPSRLSTDGSEGDDFDYTTNKTLPANFPKGYDAFYCMKYEASQQMYADFLAHIDAGQVGFHHWGLVENHIEMGNYYAEANYPWRAMGALTWHGIAAYLDWAGLRPLSELEYEKACRGPEYPVLAERAWGNFSYAGSGEFVLENEGTPEETISSGMGIHTGNLNAITGLNGLMRCGIFAASAQNKTREETGASYWGIMELSGNAMELTISVGNFFTKDYKGRHGDGELQLSGEASADMYTDWAFATAVGTGFRVTRISQRSQANTSVDFQIEAMGLRGVRSAQ